MPKIQFMILSMLLLSACNEQRSPSGVYRPGKFGIEEYVATFPVNKATKQELLDYIGIPDKTFSDNGIEYYSYKIWGEGVYGLEMTYSINGSIVSDVMSKETTMAWGTTSYKNSLMKRK